MNDTVSSNQSLILTAKSAEKQSVTGHIRIDCEQGGSHVRIDYNADNGYDMVTRTNQHVAGGSARQEYEQPITVQSGVVSPDKFHMQLFFDNNSMECCFLDTGQIYTLAKYSTAQTMHVMVESNQSLALTTLLGKPQP